MKVSAVSHPPAHSPMTLPGHYVPLMATSKQTYGAPLSCFFFSNVFFYSLVVSKFYFCVGNIINGCLLFSSMLGCSHRRSRVVPFQNVWTKCGGALALPRPCSRCRWRTASAPTKTSIGSVLMRSVVLQQTLLGAYLKATVQEHVVGATSSTLHVESNSFVDVFVCDHFSCFLPPYVLCVTHQDLASKFSVCVFVLLSHLIRGVWPSEPYRSSAGHVEGG